MLALAAGAVIRREASSWYERHISLPSTLIMSHPSPSHSHSHVHTRCPSFHPAFCLSLYHHPAPNSPPPPPYSPEPKLPSPSRLPPTPHPLPPPAREYTTHPPIVGKRAAGRPPSTPPLLQAQLSIYFPIHYHSPTPAKQQQTRAAPPAKASECQELRQCALVYRTSERGRRIHLQHSRKAAVHAPAVKRDGTHRYATKPPSQLPTLT